jgi:hypothetical protein
LTDNCLKASGSLSKLYNGSNSYNVSYKENCKALDYLKIVLGEDLFNKAKIKRVDFAANLKMKYPVTNYMSFISQPLGTEYVDYNNDYLGFKGAKEDLYLYDKVKSINYEDKKKKIKTNLNDENLLRLEIRFNKRLMKNLELSDLRLSQLYSKTLYKYILTRWFEGFAKLKMESTVSLQGIFPNSSVKEVKRYLIGYGINALGGIESTKIKICRAKCKPYIKHDLFEFISQNFLSQPKAYDLQIEFSKKIKSYYDVEMSMT